MLVNVTDVPDYYLQCFTDAQDPFTFMPTIRIAFLSPKADPMPDDTLMPLNATTLTTQHFYIKPEGYISRVSDTVYCLLMNAISEENRASNIIAEPALFDKYIHVYYSSAYYVGWIDAPGCAASGKPASLPVPPSPGAPTAPPSNAVSALPATATVIPVLASFLSILLLLLV
ncbi:hypothetical protein CLOM_g7781 [Closterium sp. NIES-68]|nr:hypothetical protein CLOM_g7781 [Closterium sp. NIES-68]